MAARRMFAQTIIDSDAFLDMPLSTQALYFHLSMRADDEGFINAPKKIQRMIGCGDDDLKLLIAKNFIIPFESGVVVIKHWKIHNYIRGDRITDTVYTEERAMLAVKSNGAYTLQPDVSQLSDKCQADVSQLSDSCQPSGSIGKVRLGKDSLGKDSIGESGKPQKRFTPPALEEVKAYIQERGSKVDAEHWYAHYEANGWRVGRNPMKNWKQAVITWEKNGIDRKAPEPKPNAALNYAQRQYDDDEFQSGDYMREAEEFMRKQKEEGL